jgi:hypothetical protein
VEVRKLLTQRNSVGAASQCIRHKQQLLWNNNNRSGYTLSYLQQQELVLAQETTLSVSMHQELTPGHLKEFENTFKLRIFHRGF